MSRKRRGDRGWVPRTRTVHLNPPPGITIASMGDPHFPVPDWEALELYVRWCSDVRPDVQVLQGDTFDTASLSDHRRRAKQAMDYGSLNAEAESARRYLARLRRYSKRNLVGPGNHEERVYKHIDDHPALYGMEWWHPFKAALGDWELLPRRYQLVMGRAVLCHGHTLKGALNRYSAATVLARYPGQSTFYGHTHRIDQSSHATWSKGFPLEHMAATIGLMGDIEELDYTDDEPWRLGFGVWQTFRLPDKSVGFTFTQHCILRTARGLVLHSPINDKVYS